jgi:phosphoglycolate phosphatase
VIRLVLFDIDGTLIRTGGAGLRAFERAFATEFNLREGIERLSFAGRTDVSLVREFFGLHSVAATPENLMRFFDSYLFWLDHFMDKLGGSTLPGVEKLIRELQNLPNAPLLGLLTGNVQLGAEIKLRHYRLWDSFKFGAFGNDHEDRNQLASIARQRGAHRLGRVLAGEEILVIGDTTLDIACAKAIDAKMLAVASGGHSLEQLQSHQPHWAVENLCEIDAKEICR